MFHLWAPSARTALLVFASTNILAVLAALDHTQRLKTGTTIVGVVCEDAVVLAADTRCVHLYKYPHRRRYASWSHHVFVPWQVDDGCYCGGQEL